MVPYPQELSGVMVPHYPGILVMLKYWYSFPQSLGIKSPMTRYSARARARGSHILRAIVQASTGGAVSALIESMRPKK